MSRSNTHSGFSQIALSVLTFACLSLLTPPAFAEELHVPGQYATIQDAIDAADADDHVVVAPGVYNEAFNLLGKRITVRSSDGPDVTLLDGTNLDTSIVTAESGESLDTRIEGFTLSNGVGTFASNCAGGQGRLGGGVYLFNSSATLAECVFENNVVDTAGGGVYVENGDLRVIGCTFTGNNASSGGGLAACGGQGRLLEVVNSVFDKNGPTLFGGGLWAKSGRNATVTDTLFDANESLFGGGILIAADPGDVTRIRDCEFTGNLAAHGGGVRLETSGTLFADGCTFMDNHAAFGGGMNLAVRNNAQGQQAAAHVSGCTFVENEGGFAGGLFAQALMNTDWELIDPEIYLTDSLFVGNVANGCCRTGSYGTECFTDGLGNGRFYGGAADLRTFYGGRIELVNCVAIENDGIVAGGFHLATCGGGDIRVVNSTIADNATSGLHLRLGEANSYQVASSIDVANSIAWRNGDNDADQIILEIEGGEKLSAAIEYNNVQGGFDGEGNINAEPVFVDAEADDYRLATGSPGIDAGNNQAVPAEVEFDLAGAPRFVDDPGTEDTGKGDPPIVDMGAYEFQTGGCQPCDANCDGSVDLTDVEPFIGLLLGGDPCADCTGDTNRDGSIDLSDVEGFISCLLG